MPGTVTSMFLALGIEHLLHSKIRSVALFMQFLNEPS